EPQRHGVLRPVFDVQDPRHRVAGPHRLVEGNPEGERVVVAHDAARPRPVAPVAAGEGGGRNQHEQQNPSDSSHTTTVPPTPATPRPPRTGPPRPPRPP